MNNINKVILETLAQEIGVLKVNLTQHEVLCKTLEDENKELRKELNELKELEKGESQEEGE